MHTTQNELTSSTRFIDMNVFNYHVYSIATCVMNYVKELDYAVKCQACI